MVAVIALLLLCAPCAHTLGGKVERARTQCGEIDSELSFFVFIYEIEIRSFW